MNVSRGQELACSALYWLEVPLWAPSVLFLAWSMAWRWSCDSY